MWLFDYFKEKREKEEQRHQREKDEARKQKNENERIAREREKRLEENLKRKAEYRTKIEQETGIKPFTFCSDCHQRFESNIPVLGLQKCVRTISIIKNTEGCPGYRLKPGIGYIVKIFNNDLGRPNMSDKPMCIVSKTADKIELRGFPIEAQTPFGWQEVDYRDYGLTVYYSNNEVSKCVFHMFDRNVDIEYHKTDTHEFMTNDNQKEISKSVAEKLVEEALAKMQQGQDGDAVYHPLYKAWRAIQQEPACLKKIHDKGSVGNGLLIFLSFGTVQDIDDRQQIVSLAYLMLSEEYERDSNNMNLIKNRIILMLQDREALQYTVSSAIETTSAFDFMRLSQLHSRDALFTMMYYDLTLSPLFRNIPLFASTLNNLEAKIGNNFFGQDKSQASIKDEGKVNHSKVLAYLRKKIYENEDVDF